MSGLEHLLLIKLASASALPGSRLGQVLAQHQKMFGSVKKMKPVVGKGLNQSGLAKPEKIV